MFVLTDPFDGWLWTRGVELERGVSRVKGRLFEGAEFNSVRVSVTVLFLWCMCGLSVQCKTARPPKRSPSMLYDL